MRISKHQLICGIPAKKLRDFLKKYESYTVKAFIDEDICRPLSCAIEVITKLEQEGYIEPHPYSPKEMWRTTIQGNAFRKAKFIKPLDRAKAAACLKEFLRRVTEVNRNPDFLWFIEYVGLFGSFARPEIKEVMDIDIFLRLNKKTDSFYSTIHLVHEQDKLFKFLRNKSPYLDLQEDDSQIECLNVAPLQLFPSANNLVLADLGLGVG